MRRLPLVAPILWHLSESGWGGVVVGCVAEISGWCGAMIVYGTILDVLVYITVAKLTESHKMAHEPLLVAR